MSKDQSITANALEINELREEVNNLKSKMKELNFKICLSEEKSLIQDRVNMLLRQEIDRLEQYQRRNSVVIKGIDLNRNEENDNLKKEVIEIIEKDLELPEAVLDFDKTHRVGPIYENYKGVKQQDVVVRFKSHSARYSTYLKRKETKNKKIRITPSLTDRRRRLLLEAQKRFEGNSAINFLYCDIHGDLKLRLLEPIRFHYVHDFHNIEDIEYILYNTTHDWNDNDFSDNKRNDDKDVKP